MGRSAIGAADGLRPCARSETVCMKRGEEEQEADPARQRRAGRGRYRANARGQGAESGKGRGRGAFFRFSKPGETLGRKAMGLTRRIPGIRSNGSPVDRKNLRRHACQAAG